MGVVVRAVSATVAGLVLAACTGATPEGAAPSASPPAPSTSAAAFPWPAPRDAPLPADRGAAMLAEMQHWVDTELLPGATAAVVTPDGSWSGAAGLDGQGVRLEATSGISLGQVTQTFVAAEAVLLAERGRLDLDAPASTYVPIPQLANGATTRQLLAHRAAIPDPGEAPYAGVLTGPDDRWTAERFLEPVPRASATPGEEFAEDTTNYVLAGLVVEKASGRSLAQALDADLWTPLGLGRLALQDEQRLPEPVAAPGDDPDLPAGQTGRPYLPFRSLVSAITASHGAAGDAPSVARWGYAAYGGEVLGADGVAQLTAFDEKAGYGLATIDFTRPRWQKWHVEGFGMTAGTIGYRSALAVYPEQRLSVAVLTPSTVDVLPYVRYLVNAGRLLD